MADFITTISDIKSLIKYCHDASVSMDTLAKNKAYSVADRGTSAAIAEIFSYQEKALKKISCDVTTLAVAHSNLSFEEVIKALGE